VPFLNQYRQNPQALLFLKGFFGQYQNDKNDFLSNFTIFQWEQREKLDPRAVFVLRGEVTNALPLTDGGQRLLMTLRREGQQPEEFEIWCAGAQLLEPAANGQLVEVKGYLRTEEPEDEFGGSTGPIRAFVHELKVL
jgi:hypothetical protein